MTNEPVREIAIAFLVSCKGNPGPGSYKAKLVDLRTRAEETVEGREASTTANRMELTAVLNALNALPPGVSVTVLSGSEYVVKGMTEWLPGWRANGWRTSSKKPVLNADLWGALDAAASKHAKVAWR